MGWYTSSTFETEWNFKKDVVTEDITLYAKWVKKCVVNYYLGDTLTETVSVFKGNTVKEKAELAFGYNYYGSFLDSEYTIPFDYSSPIEDDTDIYMKKSDSIYVAETHKDGTIFTEKMSDYLEVFLGSVNSVTEENGDEAGWVENKVLSSGEECAYVNFGYTPTYGDGYVEFFAYLDITSSQILRLTFKNLGPADEMCVYFVCMEDLENEKYSLTGADYTQKFCYPNYEGSNVGAISLSKEQTNMSEDDEWIVMDLDLSEIYANGYSVWGTSKVLEKIRIQANYNSKNEDDYSNVFLIKSIEGIKKDIIVEDTEEIKNILSDDLESQITEKVTEQEDNSCGFVFPKDYDCVDKESIVLFDTYNKVSGLTLHTDNEIEYKNLDDDTASVVINVPDGKTINLDDLSTFNITLCNYGYSNELTVLLCNDLGTRLLETITIDSRMKIGKTFSYNFYKKKGMAGNLTKIELRYTAVGVDNAITISDIVFSEYKPFDIPGINLNSKTTCGFVTNDDVTVSYDSSREGTLFDVVNDGAEVETSFTNMTTTDGYSGATLSYILVSASNVEKVTAVFVIGGKEVPYEFNLDTNSKGNKTLKTSVDFDMESRGKVEGLKLIFNGTGKLLIKSIKFDVGETTIDYSQSLEKLLKVRTEWLSECAYSYDTINSAGRLTSTSSASFFTESMYIGYSSTNFADSVPYTFGNIKIESGKTTKVKIVYQNRTSSNELTFIAGFDRNTYGPSDGAGLPYFENYNVEIDSNMSEYEWSTITFEVPSSFEGLYLAKYLIRFSGSDIYIRAVAFE